MPLLAVLSICFRATLITVSASLLFSSMAVTAFLMWVFINVFACTFRKRFRLFVKISFFAAFLFAMFFLLLIDFVSFIF